MSSLNLKRKSLRKYSEARYLDPDSEDDPANLKKHRNLYWLHSEMERLADDVIDREICKRLRQFAGQIEYDLPSAVIQAIKAGRDVETDAIPEGLLPFYRHFHFMKKRAGKNKKQGKSRK